MLVISVRVGWNLVLSPSLARFACPGELSSNTKSHETWGLLWKCPLLDLGWTWGPLPTALVKQRDNGTHFIFYAILGPIFVSANVMQMLFYPKNDNLCRCFSNVTDSLSSLVQAMARHRTGDNTTWTNEDQIYRKIIGSSRMLQCNLAHLERCFLVYFI